MAVMGKHSLDYLLLFSLTFALILLAAQPTFSAQENPDNPSIQSPTVHQCRGHIENALKEFIVHSTAEAVGEAQSSEEESQSKEEPGGGKEVESHEDESDKDSKEETDEKQDETKEDSSSDEKTDSGEDTKQSQEDLKAEEKESDESGESKEESSQSGEDEIDDKESVETEVKGVVADEEGEESDEKQDKSGEDQHDESGETQEESVEKGGEEKESSEESEEEKKDDSEEKIDEKSEKSDESGEGDGSESTEKDTSKQDEDEDKSQEAVSGQEEAESKEGDSKESDESKEGESKETDESKGGESKETDESKEGESKETDESKGGESKESGESKGEETESKESGEDTAEDVDDAKSGESGESGEDASKGSDEDEQTEAHKPGAGEDVSDESGEHADSGESETEEKKSEESDEEETEPIELRTRTHVEDLLGLDDESMAQTIASEKPVQITLKELKKMYDLAVRPMEVLYKFKDISNRFVGDAEIFSKPMLLFIGPWSSGKSTMINYLLDIEDTKFSLKTGAEPQSNGFTVLMYGETEQTMEGIEIAADWAFSTLQKFGQSFLDRLQGFKLPNNLLRKVTIVDTPGIIENRKQQDRTYPFNDACQWFIDRADIIYVVFDPTKLDMGLEMEALFDQLKGREAQVRIVLNKADTVSPQELMQVQSTLLWNLSPLLGSSEPPTIFVGTLWSHQFLPGSPQTLFNAQESALLQDLRQTIDGRVENKISFTRRHAVRVRNHAKMVDCYLNTYYNHKTFFSNKKKVADEIIENPQNYHIYEGLSTLTNVSRYDLPDPDIYRDFFKVNPLYDFKLLASTCSYFKGCPLDKLDLAIAYDLPELMGKYRKSIGSGGLSEGTGGKR